MRIETDSLQAPSKFNGSFQENGAKTLAGRITQGLQFKCIRYGNQVTSTDCIKSVRTMCRECATGQTIRRKNGLREPSWFAPIDIQNQKSEDEMPTKKKKKEPKIITCPGCGRENMRLKARGMCARCYPYAAAGKPVPPLEDAAKVAVQAEAKPTTERKPQPAPQPAPEPVFYMEAPEQIGPLDDRTTATELTQADVDVQPDEGCEELVIDLGVVVDMDLADRDEVLEVMADFADMAKSQVRGPEAEVFKMMQTAVRIFKRK
jgi:hypothetical protein